MIKVDQYTCGQHVFFNLHNGKNENDLKIMLKSYKLSKLAGRIYSLILMMMLPENSGHSFVLS